MQWSYTREHPGKASSCFAMRPRAGACPRVETRREGGGDRWQSGEADMQAGDAGALFMTETAPFFSLDLLIPNMNSIGSKNKKNSSNYIFHLCFKQ